VEGGEERSDQRSLSREEAAEALAHEMNGEPLLPQHGFPLRLLVPGSRCSASP
jgi:DMSO/TMAO reductase YedYZ molybdopterin-dependent catalytic subunit